MPMHNIGMGLVRFTYRYTSTLLKSVLKYHASYFIITSIRYLVELTILTVNCTNITSIKHLITIGFIFIIGCNHTNKSSQQRIKTNEKNALVFRFISNSNDLENEVKILQTTNEVSYHTFDFNKNLIIMKSQSQNGNWKTFEFKIKKSKTTESLLGLKGMEFDIENPNCFQVWVSTMGNIGYEFRNGQKLVFYGVIEIK